MKISNILQIFFVLKYQVLALSKSVALPSLCVKESSLDLQYIHLVNLCLSYIQFTIHNKETMYTSILLNFYWEQQKPVKEMCDFLTLKMLLLALALIKTKIFLTHWSENAHFT